MNRQTYMTVLSVMFGLLLGLTGIVYADTTIVRGRAYNFGATPPSYAYGDFDIIGSDGIIVQQVTGTIDDWDVHIAPDVAWLNANLTPSGATITTSAPISGTGTVINPVTMSGDKGDITATLGTISIDDDAVDDTDIDFGTGAGQANSGDMPLSTSVGDTEVLFAGTGYITGDEDFTWNSTTNVLTVSSGGASISIDGANDTITASGGLIGFGDENLVTTGNLLFNKWDITGTTPTGNYLPYVVSAAGDVATMGWINPATLSTAPGGSDSHVQYNNGGVFGGEADFAWNDTNKQLLIGAPIATVATLQLIGDGAAAFVGSVYSGDEIHVGWDGIGAKNEGELWLYDGDEEALGVRVLNIAANTELDLSAIGAWTDDYLVSIDTSPVSGPAFVAVNPASITPDTDTDMEVICWDDITATTITASLIPIIAPHCIPYTGTATYTGIYIPTWTAITGADTITVTLYVDNVAKDTWTSVAGAAGSYGGAVSEALVQGHYVQIKVQVTTQTGGLDVIQVQSAVCNVVIL